MLIVLGFVITALSFAGLCGLARVYLRMPAAAAPVLCACGIAVWLSALGILGALLPGFIVLLAAGLAGLVYVYFVKKTKPDILTLFVLIAALGFCAWRFNGVYFTWADSANHWGVAAKYLLTFDSFPNSSTNVIYFQSYPLGQASFIYYCCRLLGKSEGLYLGAFFMLNTMALLPMTLFIKYNKVFGYLLVGAFAGFLVPFASPLTSLQVDGFLGCLAVGAISTIVYLHRNSVISIVAGAIFAAAFANIKSSGIFFSVVIAIFSALFVPKGKGRLRAFLIVLGAAALAFAAWELHVKLAYPNGFGTKHAVSLSHYAESFLDKWPDTMLAVASKMLVRLIRPDWYNLSLLGVMAVLLGASFVRTRRDVELSRAVPRAVISFICVYAAWYIMLFFMYVFSMPENEALELASIPRYEASAKIMIMGLSVTLTAGCFCRAKFASAAVRRAALCSAVLAGAVLALCDYKIDSNHGLSSYIRKGPPPAYYAQHIKLKEKYAVEEGKRYLVFGVKAVHGENFRRTFKYQTNYEYFPEFYTVLCQKDDGIYIQHYTLSGGLESEFIPDIGKWLSENIDNYDYVLVLDESAEFENVLPDDDSGKILRGY